MNGRRIAAALALIAGASLALAQERPAGPKPSRVALTVYNQNFAVVKEAREIDLKQGINPVVISDVAKLLDPTTVHFKSLTAPDAVAVREQNYQYDLITPATLLNKSVGKRITLRRTLPNGQKEEVKGTIVTPVEQVVAQTGESDGRPIQTYGGLVVRLDDGSLLLNPTGEIQLHEMPEGLIPIPQLAWTVDVARAGRHAAEVSYMTQGISWKADYVVVLANDDKSADLTGWVTLDNQSGATYANASLQLIAGDVRRIEQARKALPGIAGAERLAAAAPQFKEESFFEYHLYTLDGQTTVRDKEQKQMTLLSATGAPAVKKFVYDGRRGHWSVHNPEYRPGEGYDTSAQKKVNVVMELANKKPGLGVPLPKGRMRLYKADARGSLQFIGEDEIDHTPKDETLRLYVGDSFDVVGEHKRTNFRRIGEKEVEETFEISLRNHREEATPVSIIEHAWADWRITQKSHDFKKLDARTFEFAVTVPKDGAVTVTYTVRTRWL